MNRKSMSGSAVVFEANLEAKLQEMDQSEKFQSCVFKIERRLPATVGLVYRSFKYKAFKLFDFLLKITIQSFWMQQLRG